jgi:hypothetical protein
MNPGGWSRPPERLLTGRRWLDFLIGFVPPPVLVVLFFVGYGLGHDWLVGLSALLFLTAMVLCAVLQGRYPVVARGLGWGLASIPILAVLFVLGAFAVCLYSVSGSGR